MNKPLHQIWQPLKQRIARTWLLMLAITAIIILLFFLVNQFAIYKGISLRNLVLTSNEIANMPLYTGGFLYLGLLLWSATASILFMGAVLLHRKSRKAWFLISAGIFTAIIALDDVFQLHNAIADHLHIPEILLYIAYFLFLLGFLLYFFREIWNETDFPLLVGALLFMGLSISFKVGLDNYLLQGGFKILGIAFWLAYFSRTAVNFVNEKIRPD